MPRFMTPVELPAGTMEITHKNKLLLAGSCFASNIGMLLAERKFNIETNPFGVLYNPLSLSVMLNRIAKGEPFTESSAELFEHNGAWHSILHHSDFSCRTKEQLIERLNSSMHESNRMSKECDTVIITFGTAYVYTLKSCNAVAGNCHKLPGNMFERRMLSIDEIAEAMSDVIETYRSNNPGIRFILTVSPIRHLRDGAHDNQMSKATLLLAIDRLAKRFPDNILYFPAYEILLDELRDYRFYADDMTHPSQTAIEHIWECFGRCFFNSDTMKLNEEIEAVIRAVGHRPFDAESEGYRSFLHNLLRKIEAIEEKYPYLGFEKEKRQCNTLLDR